MIDPKLNELPADRASGPQRAKDETDTEQAERLRRARAGLSIQDTVGGDTLLSTGGRGVEVSGVDAGAGVGAGTTAVTPGRSGSPAPNVVPGTHGVGLTPRGASASGQSPAATARADAQSPGVSGASTTASEDVLLSANSDETIPSNEIARRAYECWNERGCPEGSPEEDWHRAERELRERRSAARANTARR
jgi:hypothetical protein